MQTKHLTSLSYATGLLLVDIDSSKLRAMTLLVKPFDCRALMSTIDRACAAPSNLI